MKTPPKIVSENRNRLLPDSNIYGLLMADQELHKMHQKLEENNSMICIYGFDVIRKELKKAPRKVIQGVNIQASLLHAYESFVKKEYVSSQKFEELAGEYYKTYSSLGGNFPKEKLLNDFLIVACASVKSINIVVSEDNATMCSELSKKAYTMVNKARSIPLPLFIGYKEFKIAILGRGFSNPIINSSNKLWVFLSLLNIFPLVLPFLHHTTIYHQVLFKYFVPNNTEVQTQG